MQLNEAFNSEQDKVISFFDIFLLLSNARDTYKLCSILEPEKTLTDPTIVNLIEKVNVFMPMVVDHFIKALQTKLMAATVRMQQEGLGFLINSATIAQEAIKKKQERLFAARKGENPLLDILISVRLFQSYLEQGMNLFIRNINTAKNEYGKLTAEQHAKIDNILVDYSDTQDFMKYTRWDEDLLSVKNQVNEAVYAALDQFGYHKLKIAFLAFDEALKINESVSKVQLTDIEIEHLGVLLKNYFETANKSYSADIMRCITRLNKIKPIYTPLLSDLQQLFEGDLLVNKINFIVRNFKSGGEVYKTYEGLGFSMVACSKLFSAFEEIQSLMKTNNAKFQAIAQVRHYNDCFVNHFQLATRFVMPLTEFNAACSSIIELLDKASSAAASLAKLKLGVSSLGQCMDVLRQKTLSINALREMTEHCEAIAVLLDKPEGSNFFSLFSTSYKPVLRDVYQYFVCISQSNDMEDYYNYAGIKLKLEEIIGGSKIDCNELLTTQKYSQPELNLLAAIYKRYHGHACKYHEDIQLDKKI